MSRDEKEKENCYHPLFEKRSLDKLINCILNSVVDEDLKIAILLLREAMRTRMREVSEYKRIQLGQREHNMGNMDRRKNQRWE